MKEGIRVYGWAEELREAEGRRLKEARDILKEIPRRALQVWANGHVRYHEDLPATLSSEEAEMLHKRDHIAWDDVTMRDILEGIRRRYEEFFAPSLHTAQPAWVEFATLERQGQVESGYAREVDDAIVLTSDRTVSGRHRAHASRCLRLFELAVAIPTNTTNRVIALLLPMATGLSKPPMAEVMPFAPRPVPPTRTDISPVEPARARHARRANAVFIALVQQARV